MGRWFVDEDCVVERLLVLFGFLVFCATLLLAAGE